MGRREYHLTPRSSRSQDTAQRLLTTLRILRSRHRCSLPIEIWGFPDELSRLGSIRDEIDALDGDVRWRTVDIGKRDGRWKQFHIVCLAISRVFQRSTYTCYRSTDTSFRPAEGRSACQVVVQRDLVSRLGLGAVDGPDFSFRFAHVQTTWSGALARLQSRRRCVIDAIATLGCAFIMHHVLIPLRFFDSQPPTRSGAFSVTCTAPPPEHGRPRRDRCSSTSELEAD